MSEVTNKESALQMQEYNVPIRFNDICVFDGAFTFLKERFSEEMRRVEEEMSYFSKMLQLYYTGKSDIGSTPWESLANSSLIEGEGEDKTLNLQFDVSQFEPEEVSVKILNNTLVVTAQHEEKSDTSVVYNQYLREFSLPSGVAPETVESALSKDGVLTVKAKLNMKELSYKDNVSNNS